MSPDNVDFTLTGSPFVFAYGEPDGSYRVYDDETTGNTLIIYFENKKVRNFLAFYSP